MVTPAEIKESSKYRDLSDKIVQRIIDENPDLGIKEIKAKLHRLYGAFQTTKRSKRDKLLENGDIEGILKTNRSSKERLGDYNILYKKIFAITGIPKRIIDLGCGLNPISYVYLGCKPKYSAYDVNEGEINFINKFFEKFGIDGKAEVFDLVSEDVKNLHEADVCFLFKVLEVIEDKGYKLAEKIVSDVNCRFVVVSFATETLSGRKMRYPTRGWFERLCERLNYEWRKVEIKNEVFYVVEK